MFDATAAAADLASLVEILEAAVDRDDAYIAAARAFADSAAAYAAARAASRSAYNVGGYDALDAAYAALEDAYSTYSAHNK